MRITAAKPSNEMLQLKETASDVDDDGLSMHQPSAAR